MTGVATATPTIRNSITGDRPLVFSRVQGLETGGRTLPDGERGCGACPCGSDDGMRWGRCFKWRGYGFGAAGWNCAARGLAAIGQAGRRSLPPGVVALP